MPALNLLYVTKDGVFDCYDKITGKVKKKYEVTPTVIPAIGDALQANTILVLPSHCGPRGLTFNGARIGASAYAALVLAQITNRAKVTKIVYLACTAQPTVAAIRGVTQVAPEAVITYSVRPSPGLSVTGHAGSMSPNDVLAITFTGNGWTYT